MTTSHDVRKLKHDLKIANKIMGRQGETIHHLRAELAEVRALNSKIERGALRRYEHKVPELIAETASLVAQATELIAVNAKLHQRIKELEAENDDLRASGE